MLFQRVEDLSFLSTSAWAFRLPSPMSVVYYQAKECSGEEGS